jgi:hypothetical protein
VSLWNTVLPVCLSVARAPPFEVAATVDPDGRTLTIVVADHGDGFLERSAEQYFDAKPFLESVKA